MPSPLDHGEDWYHMIPEHAPDGTGGVSSTWTRGSRFTALITHSVSRDTPVAEQLVGVGNMFLQVAVDLQLQDGDYVLYGACQKTFKVAGDTVLYRTPARSKGLTFKQVPIIEMELPR